MHGQYGVLVVKIDQLVGNLLLENLIGPFILQEIITQTHRNGEHYMYMNDGRQIRHTDKNKNNNAQNDMACK